MDKNDQRTRTCLLAKYGGLSLYCIVFGERCSINDKGVHFIKGDRYALIGNPNHPDGTSSYHEYSCIHDDLIDRILETDQNSDIILKVIHKELSFLSINYNRSESRSNMSSRSEMISSCHQLQTKLEKKIYEYSQKSIDDFKLINVNISPKLTDQ